MNSDGARERLHLSGHHCNCIPHYLYRKVNPSCTILIYQPSTAATRNVLWLWRSSSLLLKRDSRRQVVLSGRKVLKKRNFQFLSAAIPRFDRMLLSQRLATFLIMTEFIDSTNRTGIMEAASDYISNHTGILGSGHWRRIFSVFGEFWHF